MTNSVDRLLQCLTVFCVLFAVAFILVSELTTEKLSVPSPEPTVAEEAEVSPPTPLPTPEQPTPTEPPTDDLKLMWDLLMNELNNETAVAAILGNLKYESALCTYRWENYTVEESKGLSIYRCSDKERFTQSGGGFGLAAWSGHAQLSKLWEYVEKHNLELDSIESQISYLLYDLQDRHIMCYERLKLYDPEDIVTATEDFRQSYERSVPGDYSQYQRAKYAKEIFSALCEAEQDIYTIASAPYHFEIYQKVQQMNASLERN